MTRGRARRALRAAGLTAWLAVIALGWVARAAVARDIEQVEAVGAAAIVPGAASRRGRTPRDRAVREALIEAVRKSAAALVTIVDEVVEVVEGAEVVEGPAPPGAGKVDLARLAAALGNDPYRYVSRFRVTEDRGVQPALFSSNPDVESEYRVIVDVHVDRDLIRKRLEESGMLAVPLGAPSTFLTRITLEGLDDYRVYEAIVTTLVDGVGAVSATPIEAMPGRIVVEVESTRSGFDLLSALERAIPPHLMLIPLQVDPDWLRLRVFVREPGAGGPAKGLATEPNRELGPIDTTERNRY